MCLDCAKCRKQRAAGNRSGKDKLGQETKLAAEKQTAVSHEELQRAMAEGARKVGRIKV